MIGIRFNSAIEQVTNSQAQQWSITGATGITPTLLIVDDWLAQLGFRGRISSLFLLGLLVIRAVVYVKLSGFQLPCSCGDYSQWPQGNSSS